jgi:integrase
MSDSNSTSSPVADKPAKPTKPYPEFPLGPHPAGYWCKKIRGTLHYFGPRWHDAESAAKAADAALDEYEQQKDALHAGRKPREAADALTVKDAANAFLNAKKDLLESGELSPRTMQGYTSAAASVVATFGKARLVSDLDTDDFAKLRNKTAKRYGPHGLGTFIQCVRCLFKHAFDAGLIDKPIRFGPGFKRPSKKTLRIHRAEAGPKLFTAEEIRTMLGAALQPLKAMVLLGINCAFGNADCGNLRIGAVDLDAGMIDFPRPKTGISRRCPLWPETVAALREALAVRKEPKAAEHASLFFVTSRGLSWFKETNDSPVAKETAKLLKRLGINGRKGLGFYTLRHTFRTVADEARDQPAADFIMGHESPHMSTIYRERISDDRLKAVANHVREWLFGADARA